MTTEVKKAGTNPFVGPRPFEVGETLYGRDREITELYYLLSAERIVVLHSPSGAGKSSLVHAGLIPRLRQRFDVWRPTRVNQELSPDAGGANRYVLSALLGFEAGIPERLRRSPKALAALTLADYTATRQRRPDAPRNVLLIFDQFEEVLTADPLGVTAKRQFFDQLGELISDPKRWVLFVLREDFLAPLGPYARQVPTHLKNRYRIDLLGRDAARDAMVEPACDGGREFPAVDALLDDLRTQQVQQPDGTFKSEKGLHVEPVQLQVVCRRLWDEMPADDLSIDPEDLETFGNVDEALGVYYGDSVRKVAAADLVRERAIREWFSKKLTSVDGIRLQVRKETEASGGLANDLILALLDTHLVRSEKRAGATWYELAHDRLVRPVQYSNARSQEEFVVEVAGQLASLRGKDTGGANPYVGPRPIGEGESLYGRDAEIADLYSLLITERIVLFHAPSGAGKSSLVRAGLIPLLGKSFDIWGPSRVNQAPWIDDLAESRVNRYVLSALAGFEEGVPASLRRPPEVLVELTLAEYVTTRPRRPGAPDQVVLIFDQFEEVLTVDPMADEAKATFFDQLGELLAIPQVRALFALREEHLAPLDSYSKRVPTGLKNRFRIERLGLDGAREAIVEPALQGGREFPAAEQLVDGLATMKVQRADGTFAEQRGRYVEPVQLQVVCRRLWDTLPPDDLVIDVEDLGAFADVDEALNHYYADAVARVAAGDVVRERAIRDWFSEKLITASGGRGQVLRNAGTSGGLANELVSELLDSHLIRAEQRAGATWYELAFDRLIEPVTRNNQLWRRFHLSKVQKMASLWENQGRPPGLLLLDQDLAEGELWASGPVVVTHVEQRFLEESKKAQAIVKRERRQSRWIWVLGIVAIVVGAFAVLQMFEADAQKKEAIAQRVEAERQKLIADDNAEAVVRVLDRLVRTLQDQLKSNDFKAVLAAMTLLINDHEKEASDVVDWLPDTRFKSNQEFAELSWGLDYAARQLGAPDLTLELRNLLTARLVKARGIDPAPTWEEDDKLNQRIAISGGRFRMGSPAAEGEDNERPQHWVELSPFEIQHHEVTNLEYRRFDPQHAPDEPDNHPVTRVSWYDAMTYANWLGGRLPTEAEWEYAARAGTESRWSFGDDESEIGENAWFRGNSNGGTQPVATRKANSWRLHDMHGNVWEWVQDWSDPYPEGAVTDPVSPEWGSGRVLRGGGWNSNPHHCRSAHRGVSAPGTRIVDVGFRLVIPP